MLSPKARRMTCFDGKVFEPQGILMTRGVPCSDVGGSGLLRKVQPDETLLAARCVFGASHSQIVI